MSIPPARALVKAHPRARRRASTQETLAAHHRRQGGPGAGDQPHRAGHRCGRRCGRRRRARPPRRCPTPSRCRRPQLQPPTPAPPAPPPEHRRHRTATYGGHHREDVGLRRLPKPYSIESSTMIAALAAPIQESSGERRGCRGNEGSVGRGCSSRSTAAGGSGLENFWGPWVQGGVSAHPSRRQAAAPKSEPYGPPVPQHLLSRRQTKRAGAAAAELARADLRKMKKAAAVSRDDHS